MARQKNVDILLPRITPDIPRLRSLIICFPSRRQRFVDDTEGLAKGDPGDAEIIWGGRTGRSK